ncbi:FAD-binding protein [Actinomycetospora sp. OC33-EN08]|uniref:FAD-binding protein n=1 Tax=Actinomycetospora aurantiaca TaxID=3129233 RepID=A0ABU8MJT9_9PSEU
MTIGPQELPRRSVRGGRAGTAAELEPLVDGPVHPPHGADAAVELAADPTAGSLRRVLAVVGATGTDDVAATMRWAAAHDVGVVLLDPRPRPSSRPTPPGRPVLAISLARADRVSVDLRAHTVRAGAGAAWAAVHDAAAGAERETCGTARPRAPRALLRRAGTVAHGVGALTKRGVTLVTGDGTVHRLGGRGGDEELWWAYRVRPELVGVVTEVEIDPWDVTVLARRPALDDAERERVDAVVRRHDPFGVLPRSVEESG